MLEHVFQISELVLRVLELNELSSRREVDPGSKVVCNPKLGGHCDTIKVVDRSGRRGWRGPKPFTGKRRCAPLPAFYTYLVHE